MQRQQPFLSTQHNTLIIESTVASVKTILAHTRTGVRHRSLRHGNGNGHDNSLLNWLCHRPSHLHHLDLLGVDRLVAGQDDGLLLRTMAGPHRRVVRTQERDAEPVRVVPCVSVESKWRAVQDMEQDSRQRVGVGRRRIVAG